MAAEWASELGEEKRGHKRSHMCGCIRPRRLRSDCRTSCLFFVRRLRRRACKMPIEAREKEQATRLQMRKD